MTITIAAFYKFVAIEHPAQLNNEVVALGCRLGIRGTVLVASEGINATISGSPEAIADFLTWLRSDHRFSDLTAKESNALAHPFRRLKVRVKPEIVTFGNPEVNPAAGAGNYVRPEDWNAFIRDPDVVLVDTRNTYEFGIGTFPGAIDPKTQTFREFAAFADAELDTVRNKKVAMFCTGGIRCEKATAYLRARGFGEVYHLQGGVLKYLEVVPKEESLWLGECFIFDDRVALEHGGKPAGYQHCKVCGLPVRTNGSGAQIEMRCGTCK